MLDAPPSILITDDDAGFRDAVCCVFEPSGYRTLTASDGMEAVEIARSESIHLALLDVHMPRLDGLETLRALKQIDALLPCIMLSARLDERVIEAAQLADAFDVLSKPVTRSQLTLVVEEALRKVYNWPSSRKNV